MTITTVDLKAALEWLETYENLGDEDAVDEVADSIERVVAWMRAEIQTRNIRKVAREHGKSLPEMRRLIAEAEASGRL